MYDDAYDSSDFDSREKMESKWFRASKSVENHFKNDLADSY